MLAISPLLCESLENRILAGFPWSDLKWVAAPDSAGHQSSELLQGHLHTFDMMAMLSIEETRPTNPFHHITICQGQQQLLWFMAVPLQ
jgi:hypothetical protein